MKCSLCKNKEYQNNLGQKREVPHPKEVTGFICSECIQKDLTEKRRRKI